MFTQLIEGHVIDRKSLHRQLDRWNAELRPGAHGFVGSTAGVTDDGHGILLARFESREAAKANSQRREQGDWWTETEKCFDSEVSFTDSIDSQMLNTGGSDDAGFVQFIKAPCTDRANLEDMDRLFEEHADEFRPDVIGGIRMWTRPDYYVEAVYFTSMADARAGQSNQPPPDLAERMNEFESLMAKAEFLDIPEPWIY